MQAEVRDPEPGGSGSSHAGVTTKDVSGCPDVVRFKGRGLERHGRGCATGARNEFSGARCAFLDSGEARGAGTRDKAGRDEERAPGNGPLSGVGRCSGLLWRRAGPGGRQTFLAEGFGDQFIADGFRQPGRLRRRGCHGPLAKGAAIIRPHRLHGLAVLAEEDLTLALMGAEFDGLRRSQLGHGPGMRQHRSRPLQEQQDGEKAGKACPRAAHGIGLT
jgi:hypothetical protein